MFALFDNPCCNFTETEQYTESLRQNCKFILMSCLVNLCPIFCFKLLSKIIRLVPFSLSSLHCRAVSATLQILGQ